MTWLIASLGTSPSVLTEALWYLETTRGLTVDRLTCVGTQQSWKKSAKELFVVGGALERLRTQLHKPPTWMTEGHGFTKMIAEAKDNRDLEEAKAMDQAFRRVIKEAQEDQEHDGPVIACISGGRKTMSSSLQQAMTLLARSEDWAFHVLLNLPEGVEESAVIKSGFGYPGDPAHPGYEQVGVDAFEVPLVRLREFASTRKIDLADEALVQKLQKAVQESAVLPRLTLDLASTRLFDDARPGWELKLPPQQAMLLAAYAMTGRPMTMEEAAPHLRRIISLWRTLGIEEATKVFPAGFSELEEVVEWWLDPGEADRLPPQRSKLNALLIKNDPALHPFRLRARTDLNGQAGKGIYGFADVVYGHDPHLIRVAI